MSPKTAIIFAIVSLSLIASSFALNSGCAKKVEGLKETIQSLQYYAQDQDIMGVFSSLRIILKAKKNMTDDCKGEILGVFEERDHGWVQGCQESFGIVTDFTFETKNNEETLNTVRELSRFYPVFLQSCFYSDDYILMNMSDELQDEVTEALQELAQELLDEEDRLMRELIADLKSF